MWPFKPRMVTLPNGKQMTIKAFREQERIENEKKAELAKLTLKAKQLDVARDLDAYEEEKTERAEDKKASKWAKRLGKVGNGLRRLGDRFRDNLPLLAALVVCAVCVATTIVGQWMFYAELPWPKDGVLATLIWFIPKILPFVVEGGSWFYAIVARHLAIKQLPYAAATRKMWLFSLAAAAMNGYHGAQTLKKWEMGVVLGGASIVGPLVWHSYVAMAHLTHSGRSGAQLRAAVFQRIHHPLLSWKAAGLWAAAGGAMSREVAWRVTWMRAKGAAPGVAPTARLAPARNQWLFRLLFGRVVNPAIVLTASLPKRAERPAVSASEKPSVSADCEAAGSAEDGAPYSGGDGPASVPVSALIGAGSSAELGADESNWDALFQRWEEEFAQRSNSAAEGVENGALSSGRFPSSDAEFGASSAQGVSAADRSAEKTAEKTAESGADRAVSQRAPQRRKPSGKRGRQRSRGSAVDYRPAVEEYFRQRVAEGADLDDITGPEAARATGAAESTARNILSDLKRKHGR
jgi:hypothetical protein